MIYKVIEWVCYICRTVCMVCVGEWTFHWTVKDKKRFVIAGIIYAIGFVFLLMPKESQIPFFLFFYIGELMAWTLICAESLKKRLFKIFTVFCGVEIVLAGMEVFLEVLARVEVAEEILGLGTVLICLFGLAFVTSQKWYIKLVEYIQALPNKGAVLILWVVIGGMALLVFGNVMQKLAQADGLGLIFRILLIVEFLLVIGIIVWWVLESNQKKYYLEQNELKEEVFRTQQEYYKTIYEKDREMRSFRHDVANQLGMLQMFLQGGDMEGAKTHLESINAEFEEVSFHKIHVGDELLDAVFSMMNQKAEEKHIQLEIKGRIETKKQYNAYELCTIFSNAISNAIEACEKLESRGPICVSIMEERTLYCTVENPGTEEMYQQIQLKETSKADKENHGYGVGNIRRAVKRLNGELEYQYKEGIIKLEIFI